MKNKTLPILLKNQKILLIGGGNVALQKATVLQENNIEFTIISDTFKKKILKTCNNIIDKRYKRFLYYYRCYWKSKSSSKVVRIQKNSQHITKCS